MHLPRLALLFAGLALTLAGCQKTDTDKAFGERVHAYLLSHPEVLREVTAKLQERDQADADKKQALSLDQYRQAIEHDPRDFVANPNGKVTVTEFYDYRCPHCANAAPGVISLIHDHPNVRFVFKELPIFGPPSEKAAKGAIALKMAGGDNLALYGDLMAAHPLDGAALDRILRAHGVDPARLDQSEFKAKADAQIAATHDLAGNIGIQGTPTFIIGDTLVPGEDLDAVRAAVKQAGG